jgi:hypothetical protein
LKFFAGVNGSTAPSSTAKAVALDELATKICHTWSSSSEHDAPLTVPLRTSNTKASSEMVSGDRRVLFDQRHAIRNWKLEET